LVQLPVSFVASISFSLSTLTLPLWPCTIDFGPTNCSQLFDLNCQLLQNGMVLNVEFDIDVYIGHLHQLWRPRWQVTGDAPSCHACHIHIHIHIHINIPDLWIACGSVGQWVGQVSKPSYLLVNHRNLLLFWQHIAAGCTLWQGYKLWQGSCTHSTHIVHKQGHNCTNPHCVQPKYFVKVTAGGENTDTDSDFETG